MKLIKRNLLSKKLSIFIHVRRFLCINKILHKSTEKFSGLQFSKKALNFTLLRMLWAFKGPIRGIGAPTPIFEPYISSYNHIFDQNATKLHFLYSTKLVGYKYVEKNVEKILQHFLEEKKTHFFGVGAPTPIFEPYISSYIHIFDQMPIIFSFCIQLKQQHMYMWKIL